MEEINFLKLKAFLNHNYYAINSLQDKMKVVHFDEFDSAML